MSANKSVMEHDSPPEQAKTVLRHATSLPGETVEVVREAHGHQVMIRSCTPTNLNA